MKYIVYKTTNLINNKIYIGIHGTKDPSIFDGYIGNGINIFRHNKFINSIPFHRAVVKYGYNAFYRETLHVYSSKQEALAMELSLVDNDFINRSDTYNITLGGGAPPRSDIKCYQYTLTGEFLREWSSISEASSFFGNTSSGTINIAIQKQRTSYNSLWTTYKTDLLDISTFNVYNPSKRVYVYNSLLKYVTFYNSISECARELNACLSNVQRAIKNQTKVKGKYVSFNLYDTLELNKESTTQKLLNNTSNLQSKCKQVGQFTLDGKLVKIFNSVRDARKEFSNVSRVLNGTATHCKGFHFKYIESQ